jgi:hypothetical protein
MRVITTRRQHVTALVALVLIILTVVVAVSAARIAAGDSRTRSPAAEAPAVTPTTADPRGPVTDAGVNPWAANDPARWLRVLEERCPDAPPIADVDELIPALQACLVSSP